MTKKLKKVLTSEEKKVRRSERAEAVNTVVKAASGFKIALEIIGGLMGLAALCVFLYTMVVMLHSCEKIIVR